MLNNKNNGYMETKLNVTLTNGKQVEISKQGFVVKIWNGGKWNIVGAFEPIDYDKAEKCYNKYLNNGWRNIQICQLS